MRLGLVLGLATLIAIATNAWAQVDDGAGDRFALIETRVEQGMSAASAPGVAFAIIENGQTRAGARGVIRQGGDEAVTVDTPFAIGSVSKSFTAVAVLQLVEAGDVELDDPIGTHLDAFAGQAGAGITLRQLLSHTSGYSTLQGNQSHQGPVQPASALEARVRNLAVMVPSAQPGTRWQYSNANYLILGQLVETLSGRDFSDYIAAEILRPAGMDNSFVGEAVTRDGVAIAHAPWFTGARAVSDRSGSSERPTSDGMAPAGGILASAADLARYLSLITNGEDDLLSAESKALMLSPSGPIAPFYGLGWYIDEPGGMAYHTGLVPGSEAIAAVSLVEQHAALVLVNRSSGMGFGVTADLLSGVTAAAFDQPYEMGARFLSTKSFYVFLLILPIFFVAGTLGAILLRRGLRAKSGLSGLLSLWFPLLVVLAMSGVFLVLVPRLFGVPLSTLALYQPDMVVLLYLSSIAGMVMVAVRLALFYLGRGVTSS